MGRLSQEYYLTEVALARENKGLFAHSWVFVGLDSDIPNAGDFLTASIGAFPVTVIRQKDGTIRAFHNICRHRGVTLLEGRGNTGSSVVCPYHRWTYQTDGRLKGIPNATTCFPDLDRTDYPLKDAAIGEMNGLVFVNPDPKADFSNWIDPVAEKLWPHDLGSKDLREAETLNYRMECNWKLFVENAIDGYHLAYLHENTLGGPMPESNIWEKYGEHLVWYALDKDGQRDPLPEKSRKEYRQYSTKKIPHVKDNEYGGVYYMFPLTIIDSNDYGLNISRLEPRGAGQCDLIIRRWLGPGQGLDERKYIPGWDKATNLIQSKNWRKHPLQTNDFQTEDVWICEKIQKGFSSPAYEHGPLARGAGAEQSIRWFHEMYDLSIRT